MGPQTLVEKTLKCAKVVLFVPKVCLLEHVDFGEIAGSVRMSIFDCISTVSETTGLPIMTAEAVTTDDCPSSCKEVDSPCAQDICKECSLCKGEAYVFLMPLLPGHMTAVWRWIIASTLCAYIAGECPVFCDDSADPCGDDSNVCKDCPFCPKGTPRCDHTNFVILSSSG